MEGIVTINKVNNSWERSPIKYRRENAKIKKLNIQMVIGEPPTIHHTNEKNGKNPTLQVLLGMY